MRQGGFRQKNHSEFDLKLRKLVDWRFEQVLLRYAGQWRRLVMANNVAPVFFASFPGFTLGLWPLRGVSPLAAFGGLPALSGYSLTEFFVNAPNRLPPGKAAGGRDVPRHQAAPFLGVLLAGLAMRVPTCLQVRFQDLH
jgi:hypothetical protein